VFVFSLLFFIDPDLCSFFCGFNDFDDEFDEFDEFDALLLLLSERRPWPAGDLFLGAGGVLGVVWPFGVRETPRCFSLVMAICWQSVHTVARGEPVAAMYSANSALFMCVLCM
jgi:hypothetical protein